MSFQNFFDRMDAERALAIDAASRRLYELREARAALLRHYGVDDEAALVAAIACGAQPPLPAWTHCLAARQLAARQDAERARIAALLSRLPDDVAVDAPDWAVLADALIDRYGEHLADAPTASEDMLTLRLANGTELFACAHGDDFAIAWRSAGRDLAVANPPIAQTALLFDQGSSRPAPAALVAGPTLQARLVAVVGQLIHDPLLETLC